MKYIHLLQKSTLGVLSACLMVTSFNANAMLLSRLGGQAYYDTDLNITWLADANAGAGSIYDDGSNTTDGRMTWTNADAWVSNLTVAGIGGWRLPDTNPIDGATLNNTPSFDGSTDRGYNISAPITGSAFPGATGSEMAHMFYNTLGNASGFLADGTSIGCPGGLSACLTNPGVFSNLIASGYWSGSTFPFVSTSRWQFKFNLGEQGGTGDTANNYAWAVRDGDIGVVPIPAAIWLFGSGLIGLAGLAGLARRKK
jgi:hypothetical protein